MTDATPPQNEKETPLKKVSKRKMIFVQIDEEITSIFERAKLVPYSEIYFVVPHRSILLQSIVNLRILKEKMTELEKNMALITSDPNGMQLALQCEIKVYDEWKSFQENPENPLSSPKIFAPVSASSNDIQDEKPSRLPQKKASIFEVVKQIREGDKTISFKKNIERFQAELEHWFRGHGLGDRNKRFAQGTIIAAGLLFFVVASVILPGATVLIEPASSVMTKGVNIELSPRPTASKELKSYVVEAQASVKLSLQSTGVLSFGAKAGGELTVWNKEAKAWNFVEGTRFQSPEGIIFRAMAPVNLGPGSESAPSQALVRVQADDVDAQGLPVGDRGNLNPSRFFLPGLSENMKNTVYAENKVAFSGGQSSVTRFITDQDIQSAQEKLKESLEKKALSALQQEANTMGSQNSISLRLIESSDVIEYGNIQSSLPYELIGKEMPSFEVEGTMSVRTLAFDKKLLESLLSAEVQAVQTPGKEIIKIDQESIRLQIISFDLDQKRAKFTASIQAVEEFVVDQKEEEGLKLAKRIKEHIRGKSLMEAKSFIENLPEVNKVEMKMWPRWSKKIPKLEENIRIKRMDS